MSIRDRGIYLTIWYVEKWGDHLMSTMYKDSSIRLMFINGIDAEVQRLKGEGYMEVKE